MTPQQDSLSGVIICPAYWKGQRLRVNSLTTYTDTIVDCRENVNWTLDLDSGCHLLVTALGPPLGKVSIVPASHEEWNQNQAIAIFRTIEGIERGYLAGLLMTVQILRWATQRAKATSGQFNLTLEICRDLPIPLPPVAEQRRIIAELDRQITNLDKTGLLVDSSTFSEPNNVPEQALSQAVAFAAHPWCNAMLFEYLTEVVAGVFHPTDEDLSVGAPVLAAAIATE
jgi:hypothetical protein